MLDSELHIKPHSALMLTLCNMWTRAAQLIQILSQHGRVQNPKRRSCNLLIRCKKDQSH